MFSFPFAPHSLSGELPLATMLALLPADGTVGVWLRGVRQPVTVLARRGPRCRRLCCDGDLGRLLRHASRIAVRCGTAVHIVGADELIRARALRIVAGTPYVPALESLRGTFPDARLAAPALHVPLSHRSAEEVLAECATIGVPVARTRIIYEHPSSSRPDG